MGGVRDGVYYGWLALWDFGYYFFVFLYFYIFCIYTIIMYYILDFMGCCIFILYHTFNKKIIIITDQKINIKNYYEK